MKKNCLKRVHQMETDIEIGSSLLWTFSLRIREKRKIKWNKRKKFLPLVRFLSKKICCFYFFGNVSKIECLNRATANKWTEAISIFSSLFTILLPLLPWWNYLFIMKIKDERMDSAVYCHKAKKRNIFSLYVWIWTCINLILLFICPYRIIRVYICET